MSYNGQICVSCTNAMSLRTRLCGQGRDRLCRVSRKCSCLRISTPLPQPAGLALRTCCIVACHFSIGIDGSASSEKNAQIAQHKRPQIASHQRGLGQRELVSHTRLSLVPHVSFSPTKVHVLKFLM